MHGCAAVALVCAVVWCFLCSTTQLTQKTSQEKEITFALNHYVDGVLDMFKKSVRVIAALNYIAIETPVDLGGRGVADKIRIVNLISGLHRSGDVKIDINSTANTGLASAAIGFEKIGMSCRYRYRSVLNLNGRVSAVLEEISARLTVSVNATSITLQNFKVEHFGAVKIRRFTGAPFGFNWLARLVSQCVLNSQRSLIARTIEDNGIAALKRILNKVNFQTVSQKLVEIATSFVTS